MTSIDNFNAPDTCSIAAKRKAIVSGCAQSWNAMIRAWRAPRATDACWLMYSANYLFNTGGLKWAVDPVLPGNRLPDAPAIDAEHDLNDLDFVLLTHKHDDHVDANLWNQITSASRCRWIVPNHMAEFFFSKTNPARKRCLIAVPGQKIRQDGACITPFDAPHSARRATGEINQVNSTGYMVETVNGACLLPGDIRTYDPDCVKILARNGVTVFAHVFLGRSAALDPRPPLLDAFVKFYLSFCPNKIALAHLYEFARQPEDCWTAAHAAILTRAFAEAAPKTAIITPEWFTETIL